MSLDTRERILAALRSLLAGGGTAAATLESVAAEAGVSKGGLLYHFPTKQALYEGLVAHTKATVAAELGSITDPDDIVRRYLDYVAPRDAEERRFMLALVNGVRDIDRTTDGGSDTDDASVIADIFAAWEEPVRRAIADPVSAEIVLQVGNGWYLSSIAGLRAPDPQLHRRVVDRLMRSIER